MDVVVVLPVKANRQDNSPTSANHFDAVTTRKASISSSEFYVQFPAPEVALSAALNRMSLISSPTKSYRKQLSTEIVLKDGKNTDPTNGGFVTVYINGNQIQAMNMQRQSDGTCVFVKGGGLKPDSSMLADLLMREILRFGKNNLKYVWESSRKSEPGGYFLESTLYLWDSSDSIVISDIDGTITKSDVGGVMDTVVTERYSHAHKGVCKLYSDLSNLVADGHNLSSEQGTEVLYTPPKLAYPSIKFVYLTSRPIALLDSTRKFVRSLKQDNHMLPEGPVFCHKGTLSEVLYTELIKRNTYEFKSDVIQKQVVVPFANAGRLPSERLLVACFGNKDLDAVAYELAGAAKDDIYIINSRSEITCMASSVPNNPLHYDSSAQLTNGRISTPPPMILRSRSVDQDDSNFHSIEMCFNDALSPSHNPPSRSPSLSSKSRNSLTRLFGLKKSSSGNTSGMLPEELSPNNSFTRAALVSETLGGDPAEAEPSSGRSKKFSKRLSSTFASLQPAKLRRMMSDSVYAVRSELGLFKSYEDPLMAEVLRSKLMMACAPEYFSPLDLKEHPLEEMLESHGQEALA